MTSQESHAFIIGGTKIILDAPVRQQLVVGDLTIVRVYPSEEMLNSYPQDKFNRNIYAYDSDGQLAWQIQEAPHGAAGEDKAYMDIRTDGNRLLAGNWLGVDYQVELKDGVVIPLNQGARPW